MAAKTPKKKASAPKYDWTHGGFFKKKYPSESAKTTYRYRKAQKISGVRGVYRRGLAGMALWTRQRRKGVTKRLRKGSRALFSRQHRWKRRTVGAALIGTAAYGVHRIRRAKKR